MRQRHAVQMEQGEKAVYAGAGEGSGLSRAAEFRSIGPSHRTSPSWRARRRRIGWRGGTPSGVGAPQFETIMIAIIAALLLGEIPEARNRTAVTFSGLLQAVVGIIPVTADVFANA